MPSRRYDIAEIFYSLQGEGVHVGRAAVFVRFAGCNLGCGWCDTDHKKRATLTSQQIADEVANVAGACRWVVLTGGEPALQVDDELLAALGRFQIAIETNGSIPLPAGLDWVTVSPKRGVVMGVYKADEAKYVLETGDPLPNIEDIAADHHLLSPAFRGPAMVDENVKWCVQLAKQDPRWKVTIQLHKLLGIA